MTKSEASALNRLLDWLLGRQPYPYHVPLPTERQAAQAAAYLADRAHAATHAGWDGNSIDRQWRQRRAAEGEHGESEDEERTGPDCPEKGSHGSTPFCRG
jgi:hypothetical protein